MDANQITGMLESNIVYDQDVGEDQVAASDPIISVIVPVYDTASFLPRCLESLLSQRFRDFEVILVDDGSTDGSSSICDDYAVRFDACQVIHTDTGGVSTARNLGIECSRGRYVGFIDSDDWVRPTMLETLHRIITETESDIAQIGIRICSGPVEEPQGNDEVRVLNPSQALIEMFQQEEYSVCTRLYSRFLFDIDKKIFPAGLTCEDRVANFRLISQASQIAVSDRVEYYYYLNYGSISYSGLDRRAFDLLTADALILGMVKSFGDEEVYSWAEDRKAKGSFSLLVKWARFGISDASLNEKEVLDLLFTDYKENYKRLIASQLTFKKKMTAWFLRYCPMLFHGILSLAKKETEINKIAGGY